MSRSMSIPVKASVLALLVVCMLQIAAPVIAGLFPVVDPMVDGVGYPHPWIVSWAMWSCATIPFLALSFFITLSAIFTAFRRQDREPRRNILLLWWILIGEVVLFLFSFLLFFISQLLFVPPPGSS